jgi:hypothetical protein
MKEGLWGKFGGRGYRSPNNEKKEEEKENRTLVPHRSFPNPVKSVP